VLCGQEFGGQFFKNKGFRSITIYAANANYISVRQPRSAAELGIPLHGERDKKVKIKYSH